MKKYLLWIILFSFISMQCFAEESQYQLMINAKLKNTKYPILEQNGQVFLALEDVVQLLEGEYTLHKNVKDRAYSVTTNGAYSYFAENHLFAIVHNKVTQLHASPFFDGSQLYLPVSVCAKLTGHYLIKSKSYLQFFKW